MVAPVVVQGGAALASQLPAVAAKLADRAPGVWSSMQEWFSGTTAGKKGVKLQDFAQSVKTAGDVKAAEYFMEQVSRHGLSSEAIGFVLPRLDTKYQAELMARIAAAVAADTAKADSLSADSGMGADALLAKRHELVSVMRSMSHIPVPGRPGRPFFDIEDLMNLWRFILTTDRKQIEEIRAQAADYPGSELYNMFGFGQRRG